jgi:hypothetical protein
MGKHQCGGNNNGEKRKSAAKAKMKSLSAEIAKIKQRNGGSMAKISIMAAKSMKENISGGNNNRK